MTVQDRARSDARLIVVDMQRIFHDASSQWSIGGYSAAERQIERLLAIAEKPAVWTRFIRDPEERGSWRAYYDRWSDCREPAESPVWGLTSPIGVEDSMVTLPTFSKWGAELAALTADDERLIIVGVATDCCVLATALGAVDAGKHVTVVSDACAGITPEAHEQALSLLSLLSPMVRVTSTDRLLEER